MFALLGREESEEGIQIHRLFIGHIVVHPVEEHEWDARFERSLGQCHLPLDGCGQAGGVVGIGDDQPGDFAPLFAANSTLARMPSSEYAQPFCGIAGRPQHIRPDAIGSPVVGDPWHARDGDHVPFASMTEGEHGLVGFDQRIASAGGAEHIVRTDTPAPESSFQYFSTTTLR